SPGHGKSLLVFDIDAASPTFGQKIAQADLGAAETFGVWFDPNDPTGERAYVSLWARRAVAEVDLSNLAKAAVARSFATDKAPSGVAFLDAQWMVVANDLG